MSNYLKNKNDFQINKGLDLQKCERDIYKNYRGRWQKIKSKKKLFSIVVRGNNKAHWLKILFKKLFSQKEKNFEVIFGDNNSDDETKEILKYYKIKKKIIIKNYRPGLAINKCLNYANGKYTIIISSHCVLLNNNWLSEYLYFMEKTWIS